MATLNIAIVQNLLKIRWCDISGVVDYDLRINNLNTVYSKTQLSESRGQESGVSEQWPWHAPLPSQQENKLN